MFSDIHVPSCGKATPVAEDHTSRILPQDPLLWGHSPIQPTRPADPPGMVAPARHQQPLARTGADWLGLEAM